MVTNKREQRYTEAFRDPGAFVERRRVEGVYPGSDRTARETLSEWQARAVMAVADAEQAELRADVRTYHDRAMASEAAEAGWQERADAAEAKVARVEALLDAEDARTAAANERFARRGVVEPKSGSPLRLVSVVASAKVRAALKGDE